jgi:uncharacterized protein YciU (UPF0263 family)
MNLMDIHLNYLMEFIGSNRKLNSLNLSWNRFSSKGVYQLVNLLKDRDQLISLSIAWNSFAPLAISEVNEINERKDHMDHILPTRIVCSYLKTSNKL